MLMSSKPGEVCSVQCHMAAIPLRHPQLVCQLEKLQCGALMFTAEPTGASMLPAAVPAELPLSQTR